MRDGKEYDVILQAFCGLLAALLERSRTGVGAAVEASRFDSATGFPGFFLQGYSLGKAPA